MWYSVLSTSQCLSTSSSILFCSLTREAGGSHQTVYNGDADAVFFFPYSIKKVTEYK